MILGKEKIKEITDKILSFSSADETFISFYNYSNAIRIRVANSEVSLPQKNDYTWVEITATFGKKSGSVTVNKFDDETLKKAVKKAEEIAKIVPPDPEYMPVLGPQEYKEINAFFENTVKFNEKDFSIELEKVLKYADEKGVTFSSFSGKDESEIAIATSKGLFAYHKSTDSFIRASGRIEEKRGTGFARDEALDIKNLNIFETGVRAVDIALKSVNPKEIEPKEYTVILEPHAVDELIGWFLYSLDARSVDEGRSPLSRKGKSPIGEKIASEKVTLITDPENPEILGMPFDYEGLPLKKRAWIENGILKNLYYTRFWAQKKGVEPTGFPMHVFMKGEEKSLDDLIKEVDEGLYITRLWYIRSTDYKTLSVTGMTRDGVFYIKGGKIVYPVKNMRFNISILDFLKNIKSLSKPKYVAGNLIPGVIAEKFRFTSITESF